MAKTDKKCHIKNHRIAFNISRSEFPNKIYPSAMSAKIWKFNVSSLQKIDSMCRSHSEDCFHGNHWIWRLISHMNGQSFPYIFRAGNLFSDVRCWVKWETFHWDNHTMQLLNLLLYFSFEDYFLSACSDGTRGGYGGIAKYTPVFKKIRWNCNWNISLKCLGTQSENFWIVQPCHCLSSSTTEGRLLLSSSQSASGTFFAVLKDRIFCKH